MQLDEFHMHYLSIKTGFIDIDNIYHLSSYINCGQTL